METSNNRKFELSGNAGASNFQLMTMALDASISGIIITDNTQQDNPIIYCNKAFEKITGYSRKEIIGHNCRFLQAQDRSQKERSILSRCIAEGVECRVEIRNYRKNGDLFWNELYMSPAYTCTITDANNCQIIKTFTITQPTAITATTSQTNVACNGASNGSASVTASGGAGSYTYSWSPSGGTAATATGLSAGTYTCTITD
ncbi:PAS domain-containing protein, partial [Streptomyces sp. NPDC001635]